MLFPLVLALVLSLAALLFAFQNADPAVVDFLVWQFESSLAVILVISFGAGLLAGILMVLPARIRSGLKSSTIKKDLAALEAKLAESQRKLEEAEAMMRRDGADDEPGPHGAVSPG